MAARATQKGSVRQVAERLAVLLFWVLFVHLGAFTSLFGGSTRTQVCQSHPILAERPPRRAHSVGKTDHPGHHPHGVLEEGVEVGRGSHVVSE